MHYLRCYRAWCACHRRYSCGSDEVTAIYWTGKLKWLAWRITWLLLVQLKAREGVAWLSERLAFGSVRGGKTVPMQWEVVRI